MLVQALSYVAHGSAASMRDSAAAVLLLQLLLFSSSILSAILLKTCQHPTGAGAHLADALYEDSTKKQQSAFKW
eukprot:11479-Heterococcus_DN1.PRE.2